MKRFLISFVLAALLIALPVFEAQAATITALQASVSKTAAFDGSSVDVSGASGDFVVKLKVTSLTAGKTAAFCLEAVAAIDFTTPTYAWCVQAKGSVASAATKTFSISSRELSYTKGLAWGQTNGKFRISLVGLDSAATVIYSAWYEQ